MTAAPTHADPTHAAKARAAWGDAPPVWVAALAAACDKAGSLAKVGALIGYSPTTVSQVINRKYAGDTAAVEVAVRAHLLAERVDCPELGTITVAACLGHRQRGFSTASPQALRLSRACPSCIHNHGAGS